MTILALYSSGAGFEVSSGGTLDGFTLGTSGLNTTTDYLAVLSGGTIESGIIYPGVNSNNNGDHIDLDNGMVRR